MTKKVLIKKHGIVVPDEEPMYLSRKSKDEVKWDNQDTVPYKVVFVNNDSPFVDKSLNVPPGGSSTSGDIDPAAPEGKGYVYYLIPISATIPLGDPVPAGAADPKIIITG